MKNISKVNFLKIISILILVVVFAPEKTFALTTETKNQENIFYYFKNVNGLSDFKKNSSKVDILAPQIYTVGDDLVIKKPKDTKILKEAKKKKANTMPLLVQKNFSKVLMSNILLDQNAQDEIINFMLTEAKKNKFIGWQFDFENINHLDRDMYTAFVKKTNEKLKAENLKFSVAVVVRDHDYDKESTNQDWSGAYDYKELAKNSDFLSLMTYDEPYSVGPVASLPYVNRTLDYILTQAPAEKLSLGVPLYCWHWQNGNRIGSTTYELAAKHYKKGKNKSKTYDVVLGAEAYRFTKDDVENVIWCDSVKGVEAKKEIVKEKGLRGFSLWALGQGDRNIWKAL